MYVKLGDTYFSGVLMVIDGDANPVTTLTDGDFIKSVYHNGVLVSITVTVTHLENGKYQAQFVPNARGTWSLIITQATYNILGWDEHFYVLGVAEVPPAAVGTFSDSYTIRVISQLDEIHMVPDAVVDIRRVQAYNLIYKYLKPEYKTKVDGGTLTDLETWDLKMAEAEIATALLCKSLATRFTLYKFNKSIASGIGGGESERDSRKNIDFKGLIQIWWDQGWGSAADYITGVPRMGDLGGLDPYSIFNFDAVKNEDLESFSTEEESLRNIAWG